MRANLSFIESLTGLCFFCCCWVALAIYFVAAGVCTFFGWVAFWSWSFHYFPTAAINVRYPPPSPSVSVCLCDALSIFTLVCVVVWRWLDRNSHSNFLSSSSLEFSSFFPCCCRFTLYDSQATLLRYGGVFFLCAFAFFVHRSIPFHICFPRRHLSREHRLRADNPE